MTIEIPKKFNPATQKYEPDLEALEKKVEEMKKEKNHSKEVETRKKEIEVQEEKIKEAEKKHSESKNKKAEGSFTLIIIIMIVSLIIASLWEKTPAIKNSVHAVLNPSAGFLLDWNLSIGMLIVVFIITLLTTIVQKYGTNQEALKELKKEQKEISKQMKEFKNHPEKLMELQKKQFKLIPKQMKLSMRAIAYTGIPFILFFRWFSDYFLEAGNPKLWLGMSWFLFYILFAIIFGAILRKWWDVV
ncbi:MAG: EMC3/TMCO1 family protein [Candidatus Daviesbacteria bacterium]|nr:EMC3/TMCO1 family protein [Candidatus Daviesbacteria bacterium]